MINVLLLHGPLGPILDLSWRLLVFGPLCVAAAATGTWLIWAPRGERGSESWLAAGLLLGVAAWAVNLVVVAALLWLWFFSGWTVVPSEFFYRHSLGPFVGILGPGGLLTVFFLAAAGVGRRRGASSEKDAL